MLPISKSAEKLFNGFCRWSVLFILDIGFYELSVLYVSSHGGEGLFIVISTKVSRLDSPISFNHCYFTRLIYSRPHAGHPALVLPWNLDFWNSFFGMFAGASGFVEINGYLG